MTNWLIKLFIKNPEDYQNREVRKQYGILGGVTGIVCNVLLFFIKYIMGSMANSIAILSDAFNNLSDSASCVVTMFGFKIAAKPADKGHPFGHGRMEYLMSLVIAALILLVGLELLGDSFGKVLNPEPVEFQWIILISLLFSIAIKLWMCLFNRKLGNRIRSSVMLATAQDSKNDVIVTSATVIALVGTLFTDLPLDGIMGVLVSLFVLHSGYSIIKDTVDMLLGQPADEKMVEELKELVLSHDRILGIHDLILHSYGPGKLIGSAHVEVSANENLLEIHEQVDHIEQDIAEQFHITMTLHMDPVDLESKERTRCRKLVGDILNQKNSALSIHDFRVITHAGITELFFDVLIPYGDPCTEEELQTYIDTELQKTGTYRTRITFDRG